MAKYIPENIIQQIQGKASIQEVVESYGIELKRKGSRLWGLSPFKDEKTASFSVSPSRNMFSCFSTNQSGNPAKFVMLMERCSWLDAMHHLAKKFNVDVNVEMSEDEKKVASQKNRLEQLLQFALAHFRKNLTDRNHGSKYVKNRCLGVEELDVFSIGSSLDEWQDLHKHAKAEGFDESEMLMLHLIRKRQKGEGFYDTFRDRLMFPIQDDWGKVVGFGARRMDAEKEAKYINSQESPIYRKAKVLYGLYQNKREIIERDEAILVEGYTDVVIPWGNGVKNCIASCGTALTKDQAKLIKRYASKVVIIRDADAAGKKATMRDLPILLAEMLDVYVVSLPEGEDPDSYSRKYGGDGLLEYITENKTEAITWLFNERRPEMTTPVMKGQIIKEIAKVVKEVNSASIHDEYAKTIAELSKSPVNVIRKEFGLAVAQEEKQEDEINWFGFRKWEHYQQLLKTTGLPASPDFLRSDDGGVLIKYYDIKGHPFRATVNKKKENYERITTKRDKRSFPYIPHRLRTEAFDFKKLIIVIDEITAHFLCELGVPAVGLSSIDGFQSRNRQAHPLIKQVLLKHDIQDIIYIINERMFALPQPASSGDGYENIDVSSVAKDSVSILQMVGGEAFDDYRTYAIHGNCWKGSYQANTARWIDRIIVDLCSAYPFPSCWNNPLHDELVRGLKADSPYFRGHYISGKPPKTFQKIFFMDSVESFLQYHGPTNLGREFQWGSNLYEIDVHGNIDIKEDNITDREVWEEEGCYFVHGKGGGKKKITEWTMRCLLEIKGSKRPFGLYEFETNRGITSQAVVYETEFVQKDQFILKVRNLPGKLTFKGGASHLIDIQSQIIKGTEEARTLDGVLGHYTPQPNGVEMGNDEKEGFYVWGDGVYSYADEDFVPVDDRGILQHHKHKYFLPAFSPFSTTENPDVFYEHERKFTMNESPIDFKEWMTQFHKVHGWRGHVGFSYYLASLFRDLIYDHYRSFPLLNFCGQTRSGKSKLSDSLSALFGDLVQHNLETNSTIASFNSHVSTIRNGLIIFNEFNPSKLADWQVLNFKGFYDGQGRSKRADAKTERTIRTQVNAGVLLMGQEVIYHIEAVNNRCIVVEFNKDRFTEQEEANLFQLQRIEKAGISSFTAELLKHRKLIKEMVLDKIEALRSSLRKRVKEISDKLESRVLLNWAMALAPLFILAEADKIYYPISASQILDHAAQQIKEHSESVESKGLMSHFWEFVAAEYGPRKALDHQCVFVYGDVLRIQPGRTIKAFRDYYSRVADAGTQTMTQKEIRASLKRHSAFMSSYPDGGIQVGWSYDINGRANPNKIHKTTCYEFDMKKLPITLPSVDWVATTDAELEAI